MHVSFDLTERNCQYQLKIIGQCDVGHIILGHIVILLIKTIMAGTL